MARCRLSSRSIFSSPLPSTASRRWRPTSRWQAQEPFKSLIAGDLKVLAGEKALVQLVMVSHAGMTTAEFEQIVKDCPIQTTAVYPIIGLTGLLNLVTVVDKFRPQAVEEQGSVCRPPSSPPSIGHSELIQLWMRLPATNRQRLLWLLSQLLEHQLSAAAQGEDSDESAPQH